MLASVVASTKEDRQDDYCSLPLIPGTALDNTTLADKTNVSTSESMGFSMLADWMSSAGCFLEGLQSTHAPPRAYSCDLSSEPSAAGLRIVEAYSADDIKAIHASVLKLLDNEWPGLKNTSFLDTWRDRDRMMQEIGPPMVLLHYETIERLGRIPHSDECRSISMAEAEAIAKSAGKRFFIEMFSHRWNSQYAPDDRWNSKARAMVEWAKYRWSSGLGTFFWIDYACINQRDVAPGVAMLPLYVSTCNNILCYDAPTYEGRAWCRVERLMFASFVAPNNEFISNDFRFDPSAERLPNNELKPKYDGKEVLPDPENGHLSYPSDSPLIGELRALCAKHWGKCWRDGLLHIVEDRGGLQSVRNLEFGRTEVRLRKF